METAGPAAIIGPLERMGQDGKRDKKGRCHSNKAQATAESWVSHGPEEEAVLWASEDAGERTSSPRIDIRI
ncbi:MAG: hypothetical protein ACUVS3_00235 [Thermodesulfobacteriota bacterium]